MSDRKQFDRTRRAVLKTGSIGIASLLAGCGSQQSDDTTTPVETETVTATATQTASPTETPIDRAAVGRQFLDRWTAGSFGEATSLLSEVQKRGIRNSVTSQFLQRIDKPFEEPEDALERLQLGMTCQHGQVNQITEVASGEGEQAVTGVIECEQDDVPLRLEISEEGLVDAITVPTEYTLPEYGDASNFTEQDLSFESDGRTYSGTLTLPTDVDSAPCAVLVHGAGIASRNGTFGKSQIFRDIAQGLSSRGVAVYRYDKQTEFPEGDYSVENITVDEAVAAINRVSSVDSVASDQLFVVGHSLGGMLAPMIADNHGGLAGMALLDSSAFGPFEQLTRVSETLLERDFWTETEREVIRNWGEAAETAQSEGLSEVSGYFRPREPYRSRLEYDKTSVAQEVNIPTLVTHVGRGGAELKRESLDRWKEALNEGQGTYQYYENLNHYFQPGTQPFVAPELYQFHDNFSETAIEDIASWISMVAG